MRREGTEELREVCFLIGAGEAVLWADASQSAVALPDSRARWLAIWARRTEIVEIAHTHPAGGLGFSREDETTMQALDEALGRKLRYSVVTPDGMLRREPGAGEKVVGREDEPWWTGLIRLASGIRDGEERDERGGRGGGAEDDEEEADDEAEYEEER
jgi:hypothetical protein